MWQLCQTESLFPSVFTFIYSSTQGKDTYLIPESSAVDCTFLEAAIPGRHHGNQRLPLELLGSGSTPTVLQLWPRQEGHPPPQRGPDAKENTREPYPAQP